MLRFGDLGFGLFPTSTLKLILELEVKRFEIILF